MRVGAALHTFAHQHEGELVVIACHGGVVEASLITLGGLSLTRPFDLWVDNTSITEWQGRRVERSPALAPGPPQRRGPHHRSRPLRPS